MDTTDHCLLFVCLFLLHNFTVSALVAFSDDHKRAQRNTVFMKEQAWLEQDVYDGPGCAWSAGDVKQDLGSLQTQEFQKILFFKSHTKRKMGSSVGRAGGVQL